MTARRSGGQAEGKRGTPTRPTDPFELIIIGIDTDDGPDHYLYDAESNAHDAESDEEMIANVRHVGILEPILFERDGDRKLVVDGRTRVRWARAAAKLQKKAGEHVLEVPCIVKRGTKAEMYGISRAANRRRPEDSLVAQAKQLQRMIDMLGGDETGAAVKLAIAPAKAKKLLALLTTDARVQRAVERGMTLDSAARLAKLPREEQVAKLAGIQATGDRPTARKVKAAVTGGEEVMTAGQRIAEAVRRIDALDRERLSGPAVLFIDEIRSVLKPARAEVQS